MNCMERMASDMINDKDKLKVQELSLDDLEGVSGGQSINVASCKDVTIKKIKTTSGGSTTSSGSGTSSIRLPKA